MMKFLSKKSLTNKQIFAFIGLAIFINMLGFFVPVLSSNDSNFYAVIAKNIVLSNDWVNLTFNGQDWLDKPHFPFWLITISYKIFGVNTFAYILPGFLFNVLGGYYTYLLAKHLFASKEVGLLSALIYFTSLHLMISSIDIRQEAYLLGEIIPACYYWYLYNEHPQINKKFLLLGAFFTALAMMTKGIFILLTIFSGLIILWCVIGKWRNFLSIKWLLALIVSFIFITPELLALYIQFDMHPNKVVFGQTGVSGIGWFFWGSQFGRFFDIGPITSGKSDSIGHYFYFIHTFLWAILPWSFIFIFAASNVLKSIKSHKEVLENFQTKKNRLNYIYLVGAFIPTFILFSLTKFQLDHYTNILIPFACILCGEFLFNTTTKLTKHPIFFIQIVLSYILGILVLILALLTLNSKFFIILLVFVIVILGIFVALNNNYPLTKVIVYSVLSICLVFVFVESINATLYPKYDLGYQVTKKLSILLKDKKIIDYNVNSLSLEFLTKGIYKRVNTIQGLANESQPFYLVIDENDLKTINDNNKHILSYKLLLGKFDFIKQEKFIPTLFNREKRKKETNTIFLYLVTPIQGSSNDTKI
ncbi:MAG: ArnT family glycosyltransferase [Neisseriaceae bacterium]